MAKNHNLKFTPAQLESLKQILDEWSSMIGNGEPEEKDRIRHLRNADKMLKTNGHKRYYT